MRNIKIPNPCSEKWETMSPLEKGSFCSVCSKCVIDFTEKRPEEIKQIFVERKDEIICGRFYKHQLHKPDTPEKLKAQFFTYIPYNLQNNRILTTLFSLVMFLMGCSKEKETCTTATGATIADIKTDTLKNQDFIMGKIPMIENDSVAKIHKSDSSALKKMSSKK